MARGLSQPRILFLSLLLAFAVPLFSHVAWPTYYSSKSAVSIQGDELKVVVTIEIPVSNLVVEFNAHFSDVDLIAEIEKGRIEELEDEFRKAQFVRLGEGLTFKLNGEAPAGGWKAAETPINGRGSEGFFVYVLEYAPESSPVLESLLEVEIRNDLYPGSESLFANYVEAGGGWMVTESSTPQPPEGADLTLGSEDEMAMWSEDESRRRFRATVKRTAAAP